MLNSLRKKILASNGILLLILLSVLLFALVQLKNNQRLLFQEEEASEKLAKIGEIKDHFTNFHIDAVEFLVLLQDSSKNRRDAGYARLKRIFSSSSNNEIKSLSPKLNSYYKELINASNAFINDDKMEGTLVLNHSATVADSIMDTLNKQYNRNKQRLDSLVEAVHISNKQVSFAIYLLLVTMLVAGFLISFFLANHISKGIISLQKTVEGIESSGDLTRSAEIISNDEVGTLSASFNRLIKRLANIVSEVKERSENLKIASETLSKVTDETRQGVQNQNDAIIQVVTAMTEMEATVREVASNAEHASESANEGDREASNGSEVVNQTVAAIRELANDVQGSAEVISKLKENSENIGTVLDVIKSISDQTNLLALNAAIEAARAGEHGRGFAVVADEVRVLAHRTQESTKEIEESINLLQTGAQKAVDVMEASLLKAENAVDQAHIAGESLSMINSAVTNILAMNIQIASAAEQQSATTEEINRNLSDIQLVAEQTASGAEQTAASSNELNELGEQLQVLVSQFKV